MSKHGMTAGEALARAWRREGRTQEGVEHHTPLDALLEAEDAQPIEDRRAREEGAVALVLWLFEKGPRAVDVMQRLYGYVRAVRPELLLNMSGAEIAAIFGQTRAAESARTKLLIKTTMKKASYRYSSLPYMKTATACAKYAAVQKGNHNRARGTAAKKRAA